MELTPRDIDRLLGAWALDALDDETRAAVDDVLRANPVLARTAADLRHAAAALDDRVPGAPPADVRAAVLAAAAVHPPALVEPTAPVELFANQVDALRRLLDELTGADYRRTAAPYSWTVHGLVAHLLIIERYMAGQLGVGPLRPDADAGHLRLGADDIAAELLRPGADTGRDWSSAATTTIEALASPDAPPLDTEVQFHQWPMSIAGLLVARSFEVWTHADDIRRATGRPVEAPSPADLRAMSQFSVRSLPLVIGLVAPDAELRGARVVLTGAGGGTIDLGDPAHRDTTIVTDVVDYCRLAARRIDLDALDATIEGDERAAGDLLAASRVFAL